MDGLIHDVVIVGAGGAGLRAAIAIGEADANLSVGIVSKVYPMRSHTVSAEGGAAASIKGDDSLDAHAFDTISGSDWLADQDVVEMFVEEARRELIQLEHWGCPWSREPDGHVAVRPFGGMNHVRTWFAADKTGFHLLHTLFQTSLAARHITRYDEWLATRLLVHEGRCQGVAAIDLRSGEMHAIAAKAVILCTGGAGRVFRFTTNAAISTGDGMALAYRAGVPLKDLEFVQYHPTALPSNGVLITEGARGEGGILLNKDGYRYLQDYDLGKPLDIHDPRHPQLRSMELGPRDRVSQAFVKEVEKGRTAKGPYGDVVWLDIRFLGEKKIDEKLPFVRELCTKYVGIDPVRERIPVRPAVHYMMGGVHASIDGATPLPGLFAAGECACVSLNGANRLGSNSLPEILVMGARSGRNAARFAAENPQIALDQVRAQAADEEKDMRARFFEGSGGTDTVAAIRTDMNHAVESGAGIYREEASLRNACDSIRDLKARYGRLTLKDRSRGFNTELESALELGFMLDIAEAIVHSARARTESRGSHQRTDFPRRDDARFLRHSLAYRTDGDPRVQYLDVTITRWPPGERVYGRAE